MRDEQKNRELELIQIHFKIRVNILIREESKLIIQSWPTHHYNF